MPSEEKHGPVKSCVTKDESNSDSDDNVPFNLHMLKKRQQPKEESKIEVKREKEDEEQKEEENVRVPISSSSAKKTVKNGVKQEVEENGIANVKGRKKTVKNVKEEDKVVLKDVDKKRNQTVVVKKNSNVRDKKAYDLPGQKHDPPEERDPLRIFYESLYQQIPTSEMAAVWMTEWGLLPKDEAALVYEKKKNNLQAKLRSPVKTNSAVRTASVSVKQSKNVTPAKAKGKASIKNIPATNKITKKRKAPPSGSSDDDSDNDFAMPLKNVKKRKTSG